MKMSRVWITVVTLTAALLTAGNPARGAQEVVVKPGGKPVVPPASTALVTAPLSGALEGAFFYCHAVNVSQGNLVFRIDIRDAVGSSVPWSTADCSDKLTYAPGEGCRVSAFVTGALPTYCRISVIGTGDKNAARGSLQMQDLDALSGWVAVEAR